MGQAAVVRCNEGLTNAVYTGGGYGASTAATNDKLQSCSALVVPSNDEEAVGMYHFPAGALRGADQQIARNVITQLINRLTPLYVWIYWGRAASIAQGEDPPKASRNKDVKDITKFINTHWPAIIVNGLADPKDDSNQEEFCAYDGYTKAYFEGQLPLAEVRCVARGVVEPAYTNMVHLEPLIPGPYDNLSCLVVANRKITPFILNEDYPFNIGIIP